LNDLPADVTVNSSTTGMVGGGFYNANSSAQMAAIAHVLPWITEALQEIDLESTCAAVRLADFGCSEGANSIAVMRELIAALRPATDRPIETVHSDLPTNDFSQLFLALRPDGVSTYGDTNVFSSAVGGSMFDQLLAPASCDFASTFNAIGFLSRYPLERLPGYILPNGPSASRNNGHVSDEDRAVFAAQAEADIAAFLRARARELRPGGKLILQVFGSGAEARTCDGIYDLLNDALLDHVASGEFPADIYDRYYQPVYFRTLDELTAPLTQSAEFEAVFRLDRSETYEVPVAFNETFKASGDLDAYADAYVNFFRAFTEAPLRLALRDQVGSQVLIDKIYAQAKARRWPIRTPTRFATWHSGR